MNAASIQLQRSAQQSVNFGNAISNLNLTGTISIELWLKPTINDAFELLTKNFDGQNGQDRDWDLGLNVGGGQVRVGWTQWDQNDQHSSSLQSNGIITPSSWHYIALTFDAGSQLESLYLGDPVTLPTLDNTHSAGFSNRNNSNAYLRLGCRGLSTLLSLADGLFDEIRIWNIVRSLSDLQTNYKRELAGNEPGLVFYAKLDNTFSDSGPNAFNGSPSGTPQFTSDVPFTDNTTTSTSTTTTSTSSSTTTTSTSTTTTSTSSSTTTTQTSTSTSSSTTTTSTSTTTTSTSSTTSTTTTLTSTSTTTSTSTSTSTTVTIGLRFVVERVK